MRRKRDVLADALTGRFDDPHAFLCTAMLHRIDAAAATIAELTAWIEVEIAPFADAVARLDGIPGINARFAQIVIAETGGDMDRFPTAGHLASWAGPCPGNNESAAGTTPAAPAARQLATRSARGSRLLRVTVEGHLPVRPLPAHRHPPRQQTRPRRGLPHHARDRLAPAPRPDHLPRPRPGLLPAPPGPRTPDPAPRPPAPAARPQAC